MKLCPNCGRSVLDKAIKCAYCGASLPVDVPPVQPPVSADTPAPVDHTLPESIPTSFAPAQPARRKLSRKALIAILCAAVLLLAGIGTLVFFLTKSESTGSLLKSLSISTWTERDGQKSNTYEAQINCNEQGLPVDFMTIDGGAIAATGTVEYEFDDRNAPTSVTITANVRNGNPEIIRFAFSNTYDNGKLKQVNIRTLPPEDAGSSQAQFGLFEVLLPFMRGQSCYRDALISMDGNEVQLERGRIVWQKQVPGMIVETRNEYQGDMISKMTQVFYENREELSRVETCYDHRGLIVTQATTVDGHTETVYCNYVESVDQNNQSCLIATVELKFLNTLMPYRCSLRCYLTGNHIDRIITESIIDSDYLVESMTEYASQGRNVVRTTTRTKYGDTERYQQQTYEYR